MPKFKCALIFWSLFAIFFFSTAYAEYEYLLTIDETNTVFRNLKSIESEYELKWRVINNGEIILERFAKHDPGLSYFHTLGDYEILLVNNGLPVSNTIHYKIPPPCSPSHGMPEGRYLNDNKKFKIDLNKDLSLNRSSLAQGMETMLTWVVVVDNKTGLESLAENSTTSNFKINRYLSKIPSVTKVYLIQPINRTYYKVSNEIVIKVNDDKSWQIIQSDYEINDHNFQQRR